MTAKSLSKLSRMGAGTTASALESVIDDEISRAPGGEISEQQFCDPVLEASCLSSIHSVH
jgi:hypothetical protein